MIGDEAPAVGGPNDLDALLYPPRPLPAQHRRVREYSSPRSTRTSRSPRRLLPRLDVQRDDPGARDPATEGDTLRVRFLNRGSHPHDPLPRDPPREHGRRLRGRRDGQRAHVRVRGAARGFHLYHCHATPLKKHIHKGLYGAFIIDPAEPRPPAR